MKTKHRTIPTKKESKIIIKWAEKEIKYWEDFIKDLKLLTSKKKINYKNVWNIKRK